MGHLAAVIRLSHTTVDVELALCDVECPDDTQKLYFVGARRSALGARRSWGGGEDKKCVHLVWVEDHLAVERQFTQRGGCLTGRSPIWDVPTNEPSCSSPPEPGRPLPA
jgi:hypothetical protein